VRGLPVRAAPRIPRLVSASWVFGKRPGLTELGASLALFFLEGLELSILGCVVRSPGLGGAGVDGSRRAVPRFGQRLGSLHI